MHQNEKKKQKKTHKYDADLRKDLKKCMPALLVVRVRALRIYHHLTCYLISWSLSVTRMECFFFGLLSVAVVRSLKSQWLWVVHEYVLAFRLTRLFYIINYRSVLFFSSTAHSLLSLLVVIEHRYCCCDGVCVFVGTSAIATVAIFNPLPLLLLFCWYFFSSLYSAVIVPLIYLFRIPNMEF